MQGSSPNRPFPAGYHRVRRSVPEQAAGFAPVTLEAAERHRDGVSCQTPAAYTYDANGKGRWCIDCNAPLDGEAAWHPDGADPPSWFSGLVLTAAALLILLVILVCGVALPATGEDHPGPMVTPSTYGPPSVGVR